MPVPSRILVPVDLSEEALGLVQYALQFAHAFRAPIDLIHVWEPPQYVAPDLLVASPGWDSQSIEKVAVDAAHKRLRALADQVRDAPSPLQHRVVVGEAASSILRTAEEGKHDLIVIGTHGRRGLPRLLMGSVAQKVVARAHCPVLTVHLYEHSK
ncbi:universal stress protein [Stigmatella aurantiaca]|uniref:Universal stress protein n=1 Tax=Stigmatella aurantiaca (strain DW4/3-1) TaxID=378806 RepID=Q08NL1_STIAD|nr:universal stress protein [Stigmatella aurantiaca]ADO72218.1 Universal stress family protein [Stigmatella aurantiaca DW4/3-1]EAU62071.1 universal stress protein family [Stigmatella aurantiaca DW4/3-1]